MSGHRQRRRARSSRSGGSLPILSGGLAGVMAYIVGYILNLLFVLIEIGSRDVEGTLTGTLFQQAGFIFYNAHFVSIESSRLGRTVKTNILQNEFFSVIFNIPAIIYQLVPVFILFCSGLVLGGMAGGRSAANGAKAGALVVLGYLPLALVGSFVFTVDGASPELLRSIVVFGLFYPLTFGAVGGAISGAVSR